MLLYDKTDFINTIFVGFTDIISSVHIWTFSFFFTALSAVLAMAFDVSNDNINDQISSINNLSDRLNLFLTFSITFKISYSYNSWSTAWSAVDGLIGISKRILYILISKEVEYNTILKFKDLVLLNVSLMFYTCSGENGFLTLNGNKVEYLTPEELIKIKQFEDKVKVSNNNLVLENNLPNTLMGSYIDIELRKLLYIMEDSKFSIQDINRVDKCINDLMDESGTLYNYALIPIVNIYNKFINISIIISLTIFSLSISLNGKYYGCIYVFIWSFVIFMVNEMCNTISTPFGSENNDLDLDYLYLKFLKDLNVITQDLISNRYMQQV